MNAAAEKGPAGTDPGYYEVLLCGGPNGIAARIIGSEVRELTERQRRRLRETLVAGYTIQLIMRDEATWRRNAPSLFRQIGMPGTASAVEVSP